jgi:hypothetical protein
MRPEHTFPILMMALNIGAAIWYKTIGNAWMAAYWVFVFGLNFVMTFKPN